MQKYKLSKEEEKELKWLNSKGHSIVKVKCAYCGNKFETVIQNVDRKRALKNDIFLCSDNCGEAHFFKKRRLK